jgi:hypothetical protein
MSAMSSDRQSIRATLVKLLQQGANNPLPVLSATIDMLEEIMYVSLQDMIHGALHAQANTTNWAPEGMEQDSITLDHLALSLIGQPTLLAQVLSIQKMHASERQRQTQQQQQQQQQQQ